MTRNPKATRVGSALTIAKQNIRQGGELGQGIQHGGNFPKGEQTWNVGKGRWPTGDRPINQLQIRKTEHRDRRSGNLAFSLEANIHTCHGLNLSLEVGAGISQGNLTPQSLLEGDRRRRSQIPVMQRFYVQHSLLVAHNITVSVIPVNLPV